MYIRNVLCIMMVFILSACGTVLSSSSQEINIKVVDAESGDLIPAPNCDITSPGGSISTMHENPGIVSVPRGGGTLQVHCRKKHYNQSAVSVGDSFNSVTLVNVLFWPGFIVDTVSGAYKKYPTHYVVQMSKVEE